MSSNNLQQLGDALRAHRASMGWTVRQLAAQSGLTPATISRLETGQIDTPKPEHLQRLAHAFGDEIEDYYALAGYLVPEGLPELQPYLRAKYNLPDRAVDQMDEYFQALRDRWTTSTNEENASHGGDKAP